MKANQIHISMADILQALKQMNPEEQRQLALQASKSAGLKVGAGAKYSQAIAESREEIVEKLPTAELKKALGKIPEETCYTFLSQANGAIRGSGSIVELPTKAKGVVFRGTFVREGEAVPVKDGTGKEIPLPSGGVKTAHVYKVTESAATLEGKPQRKKRSRGPRPTWTKKKNQEEAEAIQS